MISIPLDYIGALYCLDESVYFSRQSEDVDRHRYSLSNRDMDEGIQNLSLSVHCDYHGCRMNFVYLIHQEKERAGRTISSVTL